MSTQLRQQLRQQIMERTASAFAARQQKIFGNSSGAGFFPAGVGVPGGSRLGFAWGEFFSGLINTAATTYSSKELLKTQERLASTLAEAETKKMLAQVELQLAQATSLTQATALQAQQNELQNILKEMQFTGVQKWLLGAAGALTIVLIAMIAYRKMGESKRRRRN